LAKEADMKKSAKKTAESAPNSIKGFFIGQVMTVSEGCFEAQADFSEVPDPGLFGVMTEDGTMINEYDDEFEDFIFDEIGFFPI
jgi:hypothetical protein